MFSVHNSRGTKLEWPGAAEDALSYAHSISETRVQPAGTPASEERESRHYQNPEALRNPVEGRHETREGLACLAVAP